MEPKACAVRNSKEGREAFAMHRTPGDIIEKPLLPENVSEDFIFVRHPPILTWPEKVVSQSTLLDF